MSPKDRIEPLRRRVRDGRSNPTFAQDVAEVAAAVAPRAAFPVLLLFILVGFLAIQDRIDRRDPKLALAPISDEPYLSFGPMIGTAP